METRANKKILVLGKTGSGKSRRLKGIINSYNKEQNKLVLIYDWDDNPLFEEYKAIKIEDIPRLKVPASGKMPILKIVDENADENAAFEVISKHIKHALVVLEDASKYMGASFNPKTNALARFVYTSKQKDCDVAFTFHGFSQVPPRLYRQCDYGIIFKTNETASVVHNKNSVNFAVFWEQYTEIQDHPSPWFNKTLKLN